MFSIRPAIDADTAMLVGLLGQLFEQEAEFRPDPAAQRAGVRLILKDREAGRILVASADDKVVGMVTLLFTLSTALGGRVAFLDDLVVDAAVRRKGIGKALLIAAIEHCHAESIRRISLNSDGDNVAAHALYARYGFVRSPMVLFRLVT